jgi:hypothetical protein
VVSSIRVLVRIVRWRLAAAVTLQVQRGRGVRAGLMKIVFCMLIARCGSDAGYFLVEDGLGFIE